MSPALHARPLSAHRTLFMFSSRMLTARMTSLCHRTIWDRFALGRVIILRSGLFSKHEFYHHTAKAPGNSRSGTGRRAGAGISSLVGTQMISWLDRFPGTGDTAEEGAVPQKDCGVLYPITPLRNPAGSCRLSGAVLRHSGKESLYKPCFWNVRLRPMRVTWTWTGRTQGRRRWR